MSLWSSILPFVKKTDADVEAAVQKINAKAAADVAAVRKSAAVTKLASDKAAKVTAFEAALADYKARLYADPVATPVTSTAPTPGA